MLLLRALCCALDSNTADEAWISKWIAVVNCEVDVMSTDNELRALEKLIGICQDVRKRAEEGVRRVKGYRGEVDDVGRMQLYLIQDVWRDALLICGSVEGMAREERDQLL
ncbi:hypothetical protein HDV00_000654 [Rhizophlyctis rosea]|nr:hypothetical protein HDV00_000654 [Rhizophlyctis rosea]